MILLGQKIAGISFYLWEQWLMYGAIHKLRKDDFGNFDSPTRM